MKSPYSTSFQASKSKHSCSASADNRRVGSIATAAATLTLLVACGGGSGGGSTVTPVTPPPPPPPTVSNMGITAVPDSAPQAYKDAYAKYTSIVAPNGMPIHFYAQARISDEQMVRARRILNFYLENVPVSTYGANKVLVANKMAENGATLIMLNGSDDGTNDPTTDGQTLYETENILEGSTAYLNNEPRDAAFEEILHLMHDTGIGVDGPNTLPGAPELTDFQAALRLATENAIAPGVNGVTSGAQLGLWGSGELDWLNELSAENSLTQEYLAGIIDVYYGLAGEIGPNPDPYGPNTREEIRTQDPMGWALVGSDSPRQYFSEYITYDARIDASFNGTFSLTFDANQRYTYKSQYLLNATLTGANNSNLTGNARANRLSGNAGDNILDGADGVDTAVFKGNFADYTVTLMGDEVSVVDSASNRDGMVTLRNIESMEFADRIAFVEDQAIVSEADPFIGLATRRIAAQEVVASGSGVTLQLNFMDEIPMPDGSKRAWNATERAPYVAAARRWLEVIEKAGTLANYMLEFKILVLDLNTLAEGANGVATPLLENMVVDGDKVFPSQGIFAVNNCLYVEVTSAGCPEVLTGAARTAEFDANARHEMGHVFGIGALWNLNATNLAGMFEPASDGEGDFRNWVQNSASHQGLIYNQPKGIAAYNQFTGSSFNFAPVSPGHLYSDAQNENPGTVRQFNGTTLPSLDTELMAHRDLFTPVLFGFLEDLGWVITADPRPNQP